MRLWESLKRTFDSLPRHDAVPPELTERAVIPEIPGARFWMKRSSRGFMRILLAVYVFIPAVVASCVISHPQSRPGMITLTGAPITVDVPKGFVAAAEDEVVTYPTRPMRHFHLPELPSGGTPAFPDIYIEQVFGDDSAISLDSYAKKATAPTQYHSLPLPPKDLVIDGVRAIEFAQTGEMIVDFTNGGAGHADVIDYEIVFQYKGINYHCVMETGADEYKQYVPVFEEFCASVRFTETSKE